MISQDVKKFLSVMLSFILVTASSQMFVRLSDRGFCSPC
jgi:hypothetical protein